MTRIILLSLALMAGCSDNKPPSQNSDAAVPSDAGIDSPGATVDASCFTNPTTHYEIINACTDAQKIYKSSHPPLTLPDGGLPALP